MTTIIYSLMAFAIGAFVGMFLELIADNSTIENYEKEIELLSLKLEEAERHEVIEINDHRTVRDELEMPECANSVDFSQKW